ncbi:MAG: rhodanese-like domain-containing protein [Syntrophales bacterium]|nr:rhodanese-like domain-containing protein [Syntrophales bacterium]
MKRPTLTGILSLVVFLLLLPGPALSRDIAPVVSADWLEANLDHPHLVILDVRRVEQYLEGHIPKALSAFYGAWAFKKADLYTEVPDKDDLDDLIGSMGISFDSFVVVVGKTDTPRESYQCARVACTLQYAGIMNVTLLNGGMNQWVKSKKPLTTTVVRVRERPFTGNYRKDKFADREYIRKRPGDILLLDVREPDYFTGKKKQDCIAKPGHIPGAVNLPTSCAFNEDGTFKGKEALTVIAERAAGKDRTREIVTYCDTGQCCPTWAYLMREMLGYTNVRIYDGSMQEWMMDPKARVIP